MGLHYRKLLSDSDDCDYICKVEKSCSSDCDDCIKNCMKYYLPPPSDSDNTKTKTKTSTYLIISFSLVATVFFVVCCYAIYVKFFSGRNRSRRRVLSQQQTEDDDFVDEEHGPMVDHPIWYIRTTGLQQSIITAITVCKYKKGEGLIEGTECSVCLSEFQEDENLRLLPKCNHAFHLPCIDTWLRSHTNCPMCRAPIVTNPARIPSMEPNPNVLGSSSVESSRIEVLENSGDTREDSAAGEEEEGQEVDGRRVCESENSASDMVNMQPRRSVSLDSSSVAKINLALATVGVGSYGNSNRQQVEEVNEQIVSKRVSGNGNLVVKGNSSSSSSRTRYLQSAPSSMKRSRSLNGKHLLSWYSRSQKKPNAPLRSF